MELERVWNIGEHGDGSPNASKNCDFLKIDKRFKKPLNFTIKLKKSGEYFFVCSLPPALNIKNSFTLETLRLHEKFDRLSKPISRYSLQVRLLITSPYANLLERKFDLSLRLSKHETDEYKIPFHIPESYVRGDLNCTCDLRVTSHSVFKSLRLVASIYHRKNDNSGTAQPPEGDKVQIPGLGLSGTLLRRHVTYDKAEVGRIILYELFRFDEKEDKSGGKPRQRNFIDLSAKLTPIAKHEFVEYELGLNETFLSQEEMMLIRDNVLPVPERMKTWVQRYDSSSMGSNIDRLLENTTSKLEPQLIVLKDTYGVVFGGFLPGGLYVRGNSFGYGYTEVSSEGESCVFTLKKFENPNQSELEHQGYVGDQYGNFIKMYKWTKSDRYFRIVNRNGIGMGGGKQGMAFWIGEDLEAGTSCESETYGNQRLSARQVFSCLSIEVWTVKLSTKPKPK